MKLISHFQNLTPHGDARWIFDTLSEMPEAVESMDDSYAAAESETTQVEARGALDRLSFIEGMEGTIVTAETLDELTEADMKMIEAMLESELNLLDIDPTEVAKMVTAFHTMLEWAKIATNPTEEELLEKFVEESVALGVPESELEKLTAAIPKTAENEAADSTKNERNSVQVSFKVSDVFGAMTQADRVKITKCDTYINMREVMGQMYKTKFAEWVEALSGDIRAQQLANDKQAQDAMAVISGGEGDFLSKAKGAGSTLSGLVQKDKNLGNFPPNSDLGHLFGGVEIEGIGAGGYFSREIAKYVSDAGGGVGIEELQKKADVQIEAQIKAMIPGEKEFDAIKKKFSPMGKIEDGERTVEDQELLVAKLKTVTDFLVGTKYEEEYKEFIEGGGSWNFDRWMEGRKAKMGGMEKLGLLFKQIGYWFKNLKGSITGSGSAETKSALVAEMEGMIESAGDNEFISADEVADQTNWVINEGSLVEVFGKDHILERMNKKAVLPETLKTGPAADALHSMLGHDESFFIGHPITTNDLKLFAAEYGKSFGDDSKDVFHSNPETENKAGDYFLRGNEEEPGRVKDLSAGSTYFEVEGTGSRFERDYAFANSGAFFTWLKRQNANN